MVAHTCKDLRGGDWEDQELKVIPGYKELKENMGFRRHCLRIYVGNLYIPSPFCWLTLEHVSFYLFVLYFVLFLRQSFMYPRLVSDSLCS